MRLGGAGGPLGGTTLTTAELTQGTRHRRAGDYVDHTYVRIGAWIFAGFLFLLFLNRNWVQLPLGIIVYGAVVGGLTSLIAFGIALVYRANRIINFAAGD